MDQFDRILRNYYLVKDHTCNHNNKTHVLFFQRPDDEQVHSFMNADWDKFTVCEMCCNRNISSTVCSGEYVNFRLFVSGVDNSRKYNVMQHAVDNLSVLKFYHYDGNDFRPTIYSFALREKDFAYNYYESFFYRQLKGLANDVINQQIKSKDENNDLTDKIRQIVEALENMPDKKDKLWNIKFIENYEFDEMGEYVELKDLELDKFDYFDYPERW